MYGSWTEIAVLLRNFVKIYLRPIRRYGAYLYNNSIFEDFALLLNKYAP